jgi:hypothetical protein
MRHSARRPEARRGRRPSQAGRTSSTPDIESGALPGRTVWNGQFPGAVENSQCGRTCPAVIGSRRPRASVVRSRGKPTRVQAVRRVASRWSRRSKDDLDLGRARAVLAGARCVPRSAWSAGPVARPFRGRGLPPRGRPCSRARRRRRQPSAVSESHPTRFERRYERCDGASWDRSRPQRRTIRRSSNEHAGCNPFHQAGRTKRPAAAFSAIVWSPPLRRTVSCSAAGWVSRTSTSAPGTKPWS